MTLFRQENPAPPGPDRRMLQGKQTGVAKVAPVFAHKGDSLLDAGSAFDYVFSLHQTKGPT
jgi:hypothetical protein